ncbi:MAG: hypothetical protein ABIZ91_01590 [Gemmatimonadaceae bacterium]
MEVHIRNGEPRDADAVSLLARRAKAWWGYPAAWLDEWRDELTLEPAHLQSPTSFVALCDETPVGVCVAAA